MVLLVIDLEVHLCLKDSETSSAIHLSTARFITMSQAAKWS
jgi:hypothetical protein